MYNFFKPQNNNQPFSVSDKFGIRIFATFAIAIIALMVNISVYASDTTSSNEVIIDGYKYKLLSNNRAWVIGYMGYEEDLIIPSEISYDGVTYTVGCVDIEREPYKFTVDPYIKSILIPNTVAFVVMKNIHYSHSEEFSYDSTLSVLYIPNSTLVVDCDLYHNKKLDYGICILGRNVEDIDGVMCEADEFYSYPLVPPTPVYDALRFIEPENLFLPCESMELYESNKGEYDDSPSYNPIWFDGWETVVHDAKSVNPIPPRVLIPAYTDRTFICNRKYPLWWKLLDSECNEVTPESVSITTSDPAIVYEGGYLWCTSPVSGTVTITTKDGEYENTRIINISTDTKHDIVGEYFYDYDSVTHQATISKYTGSDENIEIPAAVEIMGEEYNVTAIGKAAFANSSIKSIKLPNTIKTIGEDAFEKSSITTVDLTEGIVSIGANAFDGTSISVLELPSSVETIDLSLFAMQNLEILVLDENLKTITNRYRSTSPRKLSRLYSFAATPPASDSYNFTTKNADYFYVPDGATEAYAKANQWKGLASRTLTMPEAILLPTYARMECVAGESYSNPFKLIDNQRNELEITSSEWLFTDPALMGKGMGDEFTYISGKGYVTLSATDTEGNKYYQNIFINALTSDGSGIYEITEIYDAPEEIFTLQGVKVSNRQETLSPGIYILRKGNTSRKIVIN